MEVTLKDLLDAGVHFGHQLRRWNPKSKKFVFANRNGISIIDLEKTHECLQKAFDRIEEIVGSGKDVLFVGTKRQAQDTIREAATALQMPFCANRWMGGCLTNFPTIKKSLEKYKNYLKMDADGSMNDLANKKEEAAIRREMARMHRNFEGLLGVKELPAALFVIDTKTEYIAVAEARRLKIPVVALVDTNSDPSLVDYPIPGNDDATKSIRLIVEVIMEAVQNGLNRREEDKAKKALQPKVKQEIAAAIEPEVTISPEISEQEQEGTPEVAVKEKKEVKKETASEES